jgi:hypothetical protein
MRMGQSAYKSNIRNRNVITRTDQPAGADRLQNKRDRSRQMRRSANPSHRSKGGSSEIAPARSPPIARCRFSDESRAVAWERVGVEIVMWATDRPASHDPTPPPPYPPHKGNKREGEVCAVIKLNLPPALFACDDAAFRPNPPRSRPGISAWPESGRRHSGYLGYFGPP